MNILLSVTRNQNPHEHISKMPFSFNCKITPSHRLDAPKIEHAWIAFDDDVGMPRLIKELRTSYNIVVTSVEFDENYGYHIYRMSAIEK